MRHTRLVVGFVLAAGLLPGLVAAQTASRTATIGAYVDKLAKAKALTVEFTARVGSESGAYSLTLGKPNKARIETPDTLIVLDGTNQTTYYKRQGVYLVHPQLDSVARSLFKSDELALFAPFFDRTMLAKAGATAAGAVENGGKSYQSFVLSLPNSRSSAVVWIGNDDNLIQRISMPCLVLTDGGKQSKVETRVLEMKSLMISGAADPSLFVFKPPKGAQLVTLADQPADMWYTDLSLACEAAAETNRQVFVDFMATWCGPCRQLHDQVLATDDFRRLSKFFVFVQVDVDAQKVLTSQYRVTAMPTQMVLDPSGAEIGRVVGYGGPNEFYKFISRFING